MSKKRGKSSSAAGQGRWEAGLMAYAFEEETWKANIQFIVEGNILDETHIKALSNVVKIPQRRLFSYLHKDDLINLVNELGNPKNKKPAKLPQFYEITEIIFGLQNAGQEIPLPLWAKLIKFGLINIKDLDLRRREEQKQKEEKEKTGKGSGKKRPRSKSPGKSKGKKTPEPQLPKKDWSTLKKRGEDGDDNKYIDDEPDDGPQHYIFVSGFKKPQLLPILCELGVNVNGIIKIESESYDALKKHDEHLRESQNLDDEAESAARIKLESSYKELALFWKLLPVVLDRASPTSRLQDLGVHKHIITDTILPTDWEDQENMIGFGTTLFEEIACKVYDSLDAQRQYLNYLKNLNLLHIPVHGEKPQTTPEVQPTEQRNIPSATGKREKGKASLEPPPGPADEVASPVVPPLKQEVDMRFYKDLMNCVPMESASISLIMHCMLEQIVATEDDKVPPSEKEPEPRSDGIHLALADCIADALEELCLSEEDEMMVEKDFPSYKQKKEAFVEKNKRSDGPVLLQFGDESAVRTHHLKEFDGFKPQTAEERVISHLPYSKFLSNDAQGHFISERRARLHELLQFILSSDNNDKPPMISNSEIDRALRQFVFENMEISSVNEDGIIKPPSYNARNLWDDPYHELVNKLRTMDADLCQRVDDSGDSEKLDPAKLQDELNQFVAPKRVLDGYCFQESFKKSVLLQVLEEAHQSHPCMDTYHHKRDNSTLVVFHSPMTEELKGAMKWEAKLHSDVGFRNYLKHVAGSIKDWTKVEEDKYQADLVAMEMERAKQAADALASREGGTPPSTAKRPRSKSPKKGSRRGSASRSSSKIGGQDETQQFSSPFIHPGSLKAENEIQNKQREEEERIRREKESKQSQRVESAKRGKGAKSAASKTSQDGKRPGSGKRPKSGRRSKSRSRSRSSSGDRQEKQEILDEKVEGPKLPFTGYDVGNNLINITGSASFLYPCDGGTIKSERIHFEQGQVSVKTTMYKDGHVFVLHIIDPKDLSSEAELDDLLKEPLAEKPEEQVEKADIEPSEKALDSDRPTSAELLQGKKEGDQVKGQSLFGSWSATLCDGMNLSLSGYGPDGVCKAATRADMKLLKLLGEIPPASTPTPVPPGMETPTKKGKRSPRSKSPRGKSPKGGKKKGDAAEKEAEAQKLEEQRAQEELERKLQEAEEAAESERKRNRMPAFQQVYVSCPDGLNVRCQLDPTSVVSHPESANDEYKLMVKQSYPYKTLGRQDTEQARLKPAMDEVSRTILSDGTVIKLMRDGSTKVLYCNGTVCFNPGSGPLDMKIPNTPHSLPSAVSQQAAVIAEDQRTAASAGSKKGSRGRKSSGKTNPEATATDPSVAGTTTGQVAGLEVDAQAKSEMEQERASSWFTTYISGESTVTKPNGSVQELDPLLCYVATDPVTREIMFSREDKVVRVDRPDVGGSVCDHVDGTRITRYSRQHERSSGEQEEQALAPVWYVKVECPGFATVTFSHDDYSCVTSFGSGTSLLTSIDGTYQLSHWNGGKLDIATDGAVVYTPRPDNDIIMAALSAAEVGDSPKEGEEEGSIYGKLPLPGVEPVTLGSYLMRHNAEICCEAVDQEGNVFQVKKTGEVSVISQENPIQTQTEDESDQNVRSNKPDPMDHHPPRLFVIYSDGSGTELLRLKDVQEYIGDAHLDPTTAVIKEEVPEDSKVIGLTVMRPHYGNSGDAWLIHKEEESIVPRNIRTRDLTHFPPKEVKTTGPPFSTTLGKGLAVGSAPLPFIPPPSPSCPTALELRQLIQHEPLSNEIRQHLKTKLIEFSKIAYEQELQRNSAKVQDPRTSEEQMRASDLLSLVLEFDDEGTPRSPDVVPDPSGAKRGTAVPPGGNLENQLSVLVKVKYEAAVAPPPPPVIPPPREKLTQADWDRIRRGIEEEKSGRQALKSRDVPDYFDSEAGRAWLLSQAPDMKSASQQLSSDPRRDGTEARMFLNREGSPVQDSGSDSSRVRGSRAGVKSVTPSKVRPTNPTPAHASGGGTPTKIRPENPTPFAAAAQQRNVRPSNPTPSKTASDVPYLAQQYQPSPIPENPTSAQKRDAAHLTPPQRSSESSDNSRHNNVLPLETESSDLVLTRSLMYDASGQPRRDRVKLPLSIMSDKPASIPNKKFMEVEDPVRRKVNTSSVAGGLSLGNTKVADRGFQLLPPEVVFGVLREGSTYTFPVKLKNTGIDLCRFKVKQPPPGTGIRVHYQPGPVAAGMASTMHLEIYAIAVGVEGDSGVGTINHMLEITTETDILHLPISAIVLTAYDYDNRTDAMPAGGKAPGVKLCSNKPPSREGIVRPIKMNST